MPAPSGSFNPSTAKNGTKVLIFGAGETARLAAEYFEHDSPLEVEAFVVDEGYKSGDTFAGRPLLSTAEAIDRHPPSGYVAFVACGTSRLNHDRAEMIARLKSHGYQLATYVSTRAFVWHDVQIGENCFILENNVLQSRVVIGAGTTLWSGNHIGHCTTIGMNCFVTSHVVISGYCQIGDYTFMGVNSSVADKVRIGSCNFIGMATVLNKSTEEDGLYTGHPAERSKLPARRFCKV